MNGDAWFAPPPSDWKIERAKFVVQSIDKKVNVNESNFEYIGLENVESWTGRRIVANESVLADGTANVYTPNDVLFGKLRPYLAKVTYPNQSGICSTEFLVLRPRQLIARYLKYVLLSPAFINAVNAWTYGVKMPRASWNIIGNLLIPFSDVKQQIAIADFLDRETTKADALVFKYERLIELLEEKRVALITQAVTKGLDPNIAMKDSGIEWIGKMPDHWSCRRLKYLLARPLQYGATESGDPFAEGSVRYIRITDINQDGTLREDDTQWLPGTVAQPYVLQDSDVLFARSGATVGKAFLYKSSMGPACFAGYLIRAKVKSDELLPDYARYFTMSATYWGYIRSSQSQATIENVNASLYGAMPFPLPPVPEQRRIISHLDQICGQITALRNRTSHAIHVIQERRAALITAAVTGQIKVPPFELAQGAEK